MTGLEFARAVERLCRHPRAMTAFLAELAAERMIRVAIERKLERYGELSDGTLAFVVPRAAPAPLRLVKGDGDE